MNIRKISFLACFTVIIINSLSSATPPSGRWVHMPDSMKAINNAAELESFLTSDHPVFRRWGVERLGQIGTAKDIPRILEIYSNEPFEPFGIVDRFKDVKDEALLAIGEIGGPVAESALSAIYDQLDIHNIKLPDSLDIVLYLCIALGKLSSANAIPRLEIVYQDTSLGYGTRAQALKGIYFYEISKSKYSSAADTVDYLLDKLVNNFSKDFTNYENCIISNAVQSAFWDLSFQIILQELEIQSADYKDNSDINEYLEKIKWRMAKTIEIQNK